jgi:hypothetical protein
MPGFELALMLVLDWLAARASVLTQSAVLAPA